MHTPEPDSSRAAPEARFSEPGFRDHPVIFGGRAAIRSAASCTLALEGLTLALENHVQQASELEARFAKLDAQYVHAKHKASLRAAKARAKGVPLRMRGLGKAKERLRTYMDVRGELSEEIEQILFFRSLLRGQLEDTREFGHATLADAYQPRLETLITPLERIALAGPDAKQEHDPMLVALWQTTRDRILIMLQQGSELLSALEKHLYRPEPRLRMA